MDTSGPGAPQTWAPLRPVPWVEPPQLFVPHSVPLKMGLTGLQGGGQKMPSAASTLPLQGPVLHLQEEIAVPPHRWTVDHRRENSPRTQHRVWHTGWYKRVCF